MKKRTHTAEFKTSLVLEVLQGEQEISQIATSNEIAPNLLRKWKSEFIEKATMVFDVKRDEKLKEELQEKEEENERLYKKVGQLTTEVDWLKKKSSELLGSSFAGQAASRAKK